MQGKQQECLAWATEQFGEFWGEIWNGRRTSHTWCSVWVLSVRNQGWQRAIFDWALKRSDFRELLCLVKNDSSPNKQTYRHWTRSNPHTLIKCKKLPWKSDVLGGGCRRANPPCCLVWGVGKFECILGASTQKHYMGFSEEFVNKMSILVSVGWCQLPRDGRMLRVSAIKIWRKNNFTPYCSPLVHLLSELVTSKFFIFASS